MRPVNLGQPLPGSFEAWAIEAFREIERASYEDMADVADGFKITGTLTETRELNVSSPTTANLAAVLGTLLSDLRKRGAKRVD